MKHLFSAALMICAAAASAQDSATRKDPLTINAYVEGYYSYDFNKPRSGNKPGFFYSHNRHNEFTINLAFVKLGYENERTRANIALAAGTYMNANYAAEPGVLKNIYEADVGYRLGRKKNLWFDIGILPSHIGFESAISKDCWTVTRSIGAENTPYFESGARISYTTDNSKWFISVLALNGWQRITRVVGNSLVSWGTQVQFKPSEKVMLNYSTFFGTDKPDSARQWRYFHNLYWIFQLSDHVGLTAGFDLGQEQSKKGSSRMNSWYAPVAILRYTSTARWAVALRGEYYSDEKGVIIATGTTNGFKTPGFSANVDYLPEKNIAIRLEARTLKSKDAVFVKNDGFTNINTSITFSTAISF